MEAAQSMDLMDNIVTRGQSNRSRATARPAAILLAILAFVAASLVSAGPAQAATCTTFYVSSTSGSDSNDGCSTSTPWQTLAKVNSTTFVAGNQILLQDGGA